MGRVYDGIIGAAVGDALGVPVEFLPREELSRHPVTGMRGYGTHGQPAGTWSDDTSMTLALLDSIGKKRGIDHTDIMERSLRWLLHGEYTATGDVFDVGNSTHGALMNYRRGVPPLECGGAAEHENGNGSLMRILPAAYYIHAQPGMPVGERMELVHDLSSLTHRHPVSLAGCGIYVSVALKLLDGGVTLAEGIKEGIWEAFRYYEERDWEGLRVYARLKDLESFAALPEREIKSSGYVVDTLEAALWCLRNTDSFSGCVLKAVNLGEDTDTVGMVAGGLAGIFYKAEGIPKEWLDALRKRREIEGMCGEMELS